MRYHLPIFFLILSSIILVRSGTADAQFRDTTILPRHDSIPAKPDSLLHPIDMAYQFLAGEVGFNAGFFFFGGLNAIQPSQGGSGLLGLLVSAVATPLAIHFVTSQLPLKRGNWGYGVMGALLGPFVAFAASSFLPPGYVHAYFVLSLGMTLGAELLYDLSM